MRLLVVLLFVCFQSCNQTSNVNIESYNQYRTQQIESRDSLFILHTVKEWGNLKWWKWGVRDDIFQIKRDDLHYFIGGVFYGPDKKRLVVWVGTKQPNANTIGSYNDNPDANKMCPDGADIIYSMNALIGFRKDINDIWKLYPLDNQQAGCFESKEGAINVLDQYYFDQMAGHEMYRVQQSGEEKGNRKLEAYGYNLQDEDFWEKCWLWQKDNVGSNGLYPFQIKRYRCDIEDYNRIIEVYPDRLPNETNGEYLARNGRIVKRPLRDSLSECAEPFELPEINYPEEILDLYEVN